MKQKKRFLIALPKLKGFIKALNKMKEHHKNNISRYQHSSLFDFINSDRGKLFHWLKV
jgi:hypothetical protein